MSSHAVDDFLKSCPAFILNAAEKVSVNGEGVDEKTIARLLITLLNHYWGNRLILLCSWTDSLISLARECAEVKNSSTVTAEVVKNVLTKRKAIDDAESTEKATLAEIEKDFEDKKSSLKAETDETVKQVRAMLLSNKTNDGDDMEEDIQLMDKGLQQSDIICPYSRLQFTEPMKR